MIWRRVSLLAYALGTEPVSFMQVTKVKYALWAAASTRDRVIRARSRRRDRKFWV